MGPLETPFWGRVPESYPGALPERADVLVVGGGVTGLSLLHHLARRRIRAVLVERFRLAAGASGRNAGFLLAGVAASYAEAVRTFGREEARRIWELTIENHQLMVEAARGQKIGYRRRGSAILASGDEERRQLDESAHLLTEDGFAAKWDGARLVNPGDGELDPVALVAALARTTSPGSIREQVEVAAIEPRRRDVMVRAGDAVCEAGVVILATNAYTPLLVPSIDIQPKRAQMLATAPMEPVIADLPTYSHFGFRYWRQLESREVLVGGWRDTALDDEVGYVEQTTEAIQLRLERAASELGARQPVTHRWAGVMGFTSSGLPLTGPIDGMPNVHVCAGFNGHGMGFAFVTAREVAASV